MLTHLRRWLSPPACPDEEQTRTASLLSPILLALMGLMLREGMVLWFVAPDTIPTLWINGVAVIGGAVLLRVMRLGYVRVAAGLLCALLWPMTFYYIAVSGGLRSPALSFL